MKAEMPTRSFDSDIEERRTVEIDGRNISYKISGSGPPLVFWHGWIGHEDTFGLCHEGFAEHFTVYRPAWPGYSKSEPMHGFSMQDFVELGKKFFDKLRLKDITLFGNCLGGNLAMEFAQQYPDYLKRLVLIEVHAYFPKYLYLFLIPVIGPIIYSLVFKNITGFNMINSFMPIQAKLEDDWPYVWEGFERTPVRSSLGFLRAIEKFARNKFGEYLDTYRVDIPTVYVQGGKTFGPVGEFAKHVPIYFKNLTTVSIPEGEHNPVCEVPDIFNERVLAAMGY